MRRTLYTLLLSMMLGTCAGCFLPAYSGQPARRTQELIFTSEDLRTLLDTWERFWFLDQPSHMTPTRIHGGVL